MVISHYLIKFFIFSFLGWLWETIFCSIRTGHFQNRGFLFGPLCPIYGCCLIILQLLYDFIPAIHNGQLSVWQLFLISAVGSAIAEYLTSWYLEKRFHARWWDYSKVPLNIRGRICLPVTICFGALGVVFVKFLIPLFERIPEPNPILLEITVLVMTGLFCADFALTEASLHDLVAKIEEAQKKYTDHMENAFQSIVAIEHEASEKVNEISSEAKKHLKDKADSISEHLQDTHSRIKTVSESLSGYQRHILRNMKKYRPNIHKQDVVNFGEELRRFCRELRKK